MTNATIAPSEIDELRRQNLELTNSLAHLAVENDELRMRLETRNAAMEKLWNIVRKLVADKNALKREKTGEELLAWNVVQQECALDDTSRWFATRYYVEVEGKKPEEVTDDMVVTYWSSHNGPEGFRRDLKNVKNALRFLRDRLIKLHSRHP